MKKLLTILLIVLTVAVALVSCDENNIDIGGNIDSQPGINTEKTNDTSSSNDNEDSNRQDNPGTVDTSIQVEYDADREAQDNEFPFDSIIIERNGYDLVAAGKYYGNDFENVKYYGSYYRIIDNYEDFSELTQWGNKTDESLFDDNFILVLHSYKSAYDTYYLHSKYAELNGKGRYRDFGFNESGRLTIIEGKSCSDKAVVGEEPVYREDCEVILPIETVETIYLVIPKSEMPKEIQLNGEILLIKNVIIDL
ncbi:MAG: hypothetical protein J6D23_00425 [Clostridia bacterium]|nr:hypothetical protein [Clostridia bacterium]